MIGVGDVCRWKFPKLDYRPFDPGRPRRNSRLQREQTVRCEGRR